QRPTIHGDGQQSRDFTFIEDVIQANLKAAAAPRMTGQVYNVACGRRTSLLELVAKINEMLRTSIKPIHVDPRPGDVKHSQADISRAQAELGYMPRMDIDQGIRRCVDYFAARNRKHGAGEKSCHAALAM